jgi:hypothetical protein
VVIFESALKSKILESRLEVLLQDMEKSIGIIDLALKKYA